MEISELIYRIWEYLSAKLLFVDTVKVFIRNEVNIMSMNKMTAAVTAALEKLGYRRIRELQITCPTQSRANVYLNDEYFGVFDFERNTFVD